MTSSLNVFISCKLTRINPVNSLLAAYIYFTHWKSYWQKEFVGNPFNFRGWQRLPPSSPLPPVVSLCHPSYDKLCWEELLWKYKSELNTSQRTLLFSNCWGSQVTTPGKVNRIDSNSKQIILVKPHTESREVTHWQSPPVVVLVCLDTW